MHTVTYNHSEGSCGRVKVGLKRRGGGVQKKEELFDMRVSVACCRSWEGTRSELSGVGSDVPHLLASSP